MGPYAGDRNSTYDCITHGPTFGANFDFYTNFSIEAYVDLGSTYAGRPDFEDWLECLNDIAGGYHPVMVDLEVYYAAQ